MSSSPRIILVTGSNQGIGYELVKQLAKQNSKNEVFLAARDTQKGESALAKLKEEGLNNVHFLPLDVTNQESVDKAVTLFSSRFDHLDVLVNNAGVLKLNPIPAEANVNEVKDVFEVNYFGVVRATTAFVPLLRKSKNPVILNLSSTLASLTMHTSSKEFMAFAKDLQHAGYNPSKAALNMYTIALSNTWPEVRVNSVCPGYVSTNMNGYTGTLSPTQSVEGIIKHTINIDNSGPSGKFFSHDGTIVPW